jgi:hypothetical protein
MLLTRCDECKREISVDELKRGGPWPRAVAIMIGAEQAFGGDACSETCARAALLKALDNALPHAVK